jgi:hypothetical protein
MALAIREERGRLGQKPSLERIAKRMKTFQKIEYSPAHKAIAMASIAASFGNLKKDTVSAIFSAVRAAGDLPAERAITDWLGGNLSAANQRLNTALISAGLKEPTAGDVPAFERAVASAILDIQAALQASLAPAPTPAKPTPPAKA